MQPRFLFLLLTWLMAGFDSGVESLGRRVEARLGVRTWRHYLLFVVTFADFLSGPAVPTVGWGRERVLWGLFGLHVASGLVYFFRQASGLGCS